MNERIIKIPVKTDEMLVLHDWDLPFWRKSWFAFVNDGHPYFPTRAYTRDGLSAMVKRRLGQERYGALNHILELRSTVK